MAVHHEGHAHLSKAVEDLEQKNLEIMSEMFDCKVEDLKFTRLGNEYNFHYFYVITASVNCQFLGKCKITQNE